MGIFFRSTPTVGTGLKPGENAPPAKTPFSWGRFGFAILLLVGLLVVAFITAQNDKLVDLYKVSLHGFELVLGGVMGILTGEVASR